MEKLKSIVHEIVFGSRKTKIKLIRELSGEEFETVNDVFELAEKTDEQINIALSGLFDYFSNDLIQNK